MWAPDRIRKGYPLMKEPSIAPIDRAVDISIVIVNWNTGVLLQQCVDSILKNRGDLSLEVIIIDNASSDDSLSWISKADQVKLIVNTENAGYARANNQGFQIAHGRML